MDSPSTPQMTLRDVMRLPAFRRLWLGQLVSIFGDFLAVFAVYSLISFRMRGTPFQVAGVMISFMVPLALISPVAGVFVDRWNVKRAMIASDAIRAALVLVLPFVHRPSQIYAIFLALSAVSSFFIPAQTITLRTVVPATGLLAANAMMQQAIQLTRIVAPAAAGALVAAFGERACFVIDSASFLFSALMIAGVTIARQPAPGARSAGAILEDMRAGLRFIFTHPTLGFVIVSMTAGMFALGCFSALIAVYVRDLLSGGSLLFGATTSMIGVGMIAGTLFVRRFGMNRSKKELVVFGLLGNGLSIAPMAAWPHAAVAIAGTLAIGFTAAFIIVPAQTLLQQETPAEMLGRVVSTTMSLMAFSQVFALTFSGNLADLIGIRNLYYVSAAMLLGVAAIGYGRIARSVATPAVS